MAFILSEDFKKSQYKSCKFQNNSIGHLSLEHMWTIRVSDVISFKTKHDVIVVWYWAFQIQTEDFPYVGPVNPVGQMQMAELGKSWQTPFCSQVRLAQLSGSTSQLSPLKPETFLIYIRWPEGHIHNKAIS